METLLILGTGKAQSLSDRDEQYLWAKMRRGACEGTVLAFGFFFLPAWCPSEQPAALLVPKPARAWLGAV